MINEAQIKGGVEADMKKLRNFKRICANTICKKKALLRDWANWKWCLKHWWNAITYFSFCDYTYTFNRKIRNFLWSIKKTKIIL